MLSFFHSRFFVDFDFINFDIVVFSSLSAWTSKATKRNDDVESDEKNTMLKATKKDDFEAVLPRYEVGTHYT